MNGFKDVVIVAVLVLIIGSALTYIIRAKRRGVKCIGCSACKNCRGYAGNSSCACSCEKQNNN